MSTPDWNHWLRMSGVELWQACALSLNIEPKSIVRIPNYSGAGVFLLENASGEAQEAFDKQLEILNSYDLALRVNSMRTDVSLAKVAALGRSAGWKIPSEMAAMHVPGTSPVSSKPNVVIPSPSPANICVKPISRSAAQDHAILDAIRNRSHDPKALPKPDAGKRGVKAAIRDDLTTNNKDIFLSTRVFDDAWQRLRDQKDITDK